MQKKEATVVDFNKKLEFMNSKKPENAAEHLIKLVLKDKNVTMINREMNLHLPNCYMIDLKFKSKFAEDKCYASNYEYIRYLRRGNTILFDENTSKLSFLRKGLPKFFDYSLNFSSSNDNNMKSIVIGDTISYLSNEPSLPVTVYQTYKANGENLQISYSLNLKSWIICSKNVCIAINSVDELVFYETNQSNMFCIIFSKLWFDFLSKNFSCPEKLDEFKNQLNNRTLIGESVGDPNHQHIKLYDTQEIQFYALVDNDSEEPCYSIGFFDNFCSKYGLKSVAKLKHKPVKDIQQFFELMENIYSDLLFSYMKDNGEGSVVYFTIEDELNNTSRVFSLAKLKTFEYRFMRKLREKLKDYLANKKSANHLLSNIYKESLSLLDKNKKIDFSIFMKFAQSLFNKYDQPTKLDKSIFDHFGSFIKLECEEFKSNLNIPELSLVFKQDENDNDIHQFTQLSNVGMEVEFGVEKLDNSKPYLVLSIGCVGGGKSTMFKYLKIIINSSFSHLIDLKYVSSDQIQGELFDQERKSNSNIKFEDVSKKISTAAKQQFNSKVKEYISNYEKSDKSKLCFIILDKNFPIREVFDDKNQNSFFGTSNCRRLIFYPSITNPISNDCPFSMDYVTQCYFRIKLREHETLDSSNKQFYLILFYFLALNKSHIEFGSSMQSTSETIYLRLPLTDEANDQNGSNDYSKAANALSKIVNMKSKLLFNNEQFMKEFKREVETVLKYFESRASEVTFQDTSNAVSERLKSCKLNV